MAFIKTRFNPGDRIWWVHCTGRVYEGIIGEIHCCDYQGALYCGVASPSFEANPFPTVHYSNIFKTKEEAKEYAQYQTENPDDVVPMCMSCHYNDYLKIDSGVTIPVHCNACAHSDTISCSDGMVWCGRMCRYMKEDGFCSFGERKYST